MSTALARACSLIFAPSALLRVRQTKVEPCAIAFGVA
jgi:hypothetical protein